MAELNSHPGLSGSKDKVVPTSVCHQELFPQGSSKYPEWSLQGLSTVMGECYFYSKPKALARESQTNLPGWASGAPQTSVPVPLGPTLEWSASLSLLVVPVSCSRGTCDKAP